MKNKTLVIKGKLTKAREEAKTFKGKKGEPKTYITIADADNIDDIIKECKSAYASSGDKFTPAWIKNYEGYINLSTIFDVPTKDGNEVLADIKLYVDNNVDWYNSIVSLKVILKDGAIYPSAIKVLEHGEEINPFDFD